MVIRAPNRPRCENRNRNDRAFLTPFEGQSTGLNNQSVLTETVTTPTRRLKPRSIPNSKLAIRIHRRQGDKQPRDQSRQLPTTPKNHSGQRPWLSALLRIHLTPSLTGTSVSRESKGRGRFKKNLSFLSQDTPRRTEKKRRRRKFIRRRPITPQHKDTMVRN